MIAIVDNGTGNLRSVEKALEHLGFPARITTDAEFIAGAERVILPGVGAFGDCMRGLRERGLEEPAKRAAESGRPFLGICVGMQMLFEASEESPGVPGLGIFAGEVVRFPDRPGLKVPHMGWNTLEARAGGRLLEGARLPRPAHVYFVHSYYCAPRDERIVGAWTEHGVRFASALESGNIFATQFHPEKSQTVGLSILRSFATLKAAAAL